MNKKVLVVGDVCKDIYYYGVATRLSSEAPVPIFEPQRSEVISGMAANVHRHFQQWGVQSFLKCGEQISEKVRYVDLQFGQQLLRVDNDRISDVIPYPFNASKYDTIVVSDYNKGSITSEFLSWIDAYAHQNDTALFIDTKKTDLAFIKHGIVKINEKEYGALSSKPKHCIVTMGAKGAYYTKTGEHYPIAESSEVGDVVGAGDTFISVLAHFWHVGVNDAIRLANRAAGITVRHRGTYAPRIEEFLDA